MPLLVILVAMGVAYSLLTEAPKPVRQFELTAVWATLGLIAIALLSKVDPAIALLLAGLVIAPLWYVTLQVSDQAAHEESENTAQLWRNWRANSGSHHPKRSAAAAAVSPLASRLEGLGSGQIVEEIDITDIPGALELADELPAPLRNLELAPLEVGQYQRRRAGWIRTI